MASNLTQTIWTLWTCGAALQGPTGFKQISQLPRFTLSEELFFSENGVGESVDALLLAFFSDDDLLASSSLCVSFQESHLWRRVLRIYSRHCFLKGIPLRWLGTSLRWRHGRTWLRNLRFMLWNSDLSIITWNSNLGLMVCFFWWLLNQSCRCWFFLLVNQWRWAWCTSMFINLSC